MSTPAVMIGQQLMECFHQLLRLVRSRIEPRGLTGPQFGILRHLAQAGPLTPTDLSQRLIVTPGNITGPLQRLVGLKLIEMRRSPKDRRKIHVAITQAGRQKVAEITPQLEDLLQSCLNPISTADQREFTRLLTLLNQQLHSATIHLKGSHPE
ncbi:MAG TPA: MarR family winged helix-turn-helix transcriptional regulator [Candidatus Ozemobacteraceae bacterium]|nr:MarR family winged helix-turn-helix transcriptional regulator [Candidatus Ozemobacteraceae bacterium]